MKYVISMVRVTDKTEKVIVRMALGGPNCVQTIC
jgi:hypothetical protein